MYAARKSPESRVGLILVILVLVSVILLTISNDSIVIRPKEIGLTVVTFFQRGISKTVRFSSETITSVNELRKLRAEYEILLNELTEYKEKEMRIGELEFENRQLKNIIDSSEMLEYENIPAIIIGKDPENFNSTIIINRGKKDNIKKNQPVIAVQDGKTGLVGKVMLTGSRTSIVKPIFDVSSYVAARLQNSRYEGLVNGMGTRSELLAMKYIKKYAKSEIEFGDVVITSGMRSIYPRGILIGTVKSVSAKSYETSLELSLIPSIDFARLEYVYVLRSEE